MTATARGRRAGRPDTRPRILAVARAQFFASGYQSVTLRSIADEAGVDVALISYYFRSKRGLFAATLSLTANPAEILGQLLAEGDLASLPSRLLGTLIDVWDDPVTGRPLVTALRAAASDTTMTVLVREALEREIVDKLADRIGGADGRRRAGVFAAQIAGLIFSRYLIQIQPIASMDRAQVVRLMAPALAATLHPRSLSLPRRVGRPTNGR